MADEKKEELAGRLDAWRENAREGLQGAARSFRREFSDLEKRLARAKEESAARAEEFRARLLAPLPPAEEEFRARMLMLEMEYEGRAKAAEKGLTLLTESFERCLDRLGRWAEDLCARLGGSASTMPAAPSLSEGPVPVAGESASLQILLKGVLDALARRPASAAPEPDRSLAREVKALGTELGKLKTAGPAPRDEALRKLEKRVTELGRKLKEKEDEVSVLRDARKDPPPIPAPPAVPPPATDDPRLERALAALDAEKETLEKLLKAVDARVGRAASGADPSGAWPAEREELIDQVSAAQRELTTLRNEYEQSKKAWENILAKHDEVRLKEIFQLKEELRAFKGRPKAQG